jgi:hypothetical protein
MILNTRALSLAFFAILVGSVDAQAKTSILCKAQEHWSFVEEVGHPANWSFSVQFEEQYGQLSFLSVVGVSCENLFDAYTTADRIGFVCESGIATEWHQRFSFSINRLNSDFLILKEYPYKPRLDGPTIGACVLGDKHF